MGRDLITTLRADEFHILDSMRPYVGPDGVVRVPDGHDGYVIYGPYWSMMPGTYLIQPSLAGITQEPLDESEELGVLEICDRGVVLAHTPLHANATLTARLPQIRGLEIRIRSNGKPFALFNVLIAHIASGASKSVAATEREHEAVRHVDIYLEALWQKEYAERPNIDSADFDKLWLALINDAPPSIIAKIVSSKSDDWSERLDQWISARPAPVIADIYDQHLEQNTALFTELGLDPAAIRLAASDLHSLSALHARDFGLELEAAQLERFSDSHGASTCVDWFDELERVQGGFNKLAALTGAGFITCPYTGETLRSEHSFPIDVPAQRQAFIFYKFKSVGIFYLVVAGFANSKLFLYFPKENTILRLHSSLFEWGQPRTMIDQLMRMQLRYADEVASYLTHSTKNALLSATINNVGHFFWNEASGLFQYEKQNLLKSVLVGISHSSEFIDPYLLLTDSSHITRRSTATPDELFLLAIRERLFLVKPVASHIEDDFAARVRDVAKSRATQEQIDALEKAKSSDFILWVALRDHNKVWLEQVDGNLSVINEMRSRYKSLSVFVDGTPDCRPHFEALARQALPDVTFFDGTHISMYNTMMWAFEIDAYVATIGSGLTFVTWLAAKPGIAHAETHHLGQMSFWPKVRLGAPVPITPAIQDVQDVEQRGYSNYHISPGVITELIGQLSLPPPTRNVA